MPTEQYPPLLVEFPSTSMSKSTSMKTRHRNVQFSHMSQLTMYEAAGERGSKAYSSQEMKRMKVQAVKDGLLAGRRIFTNGNSTKGFTEEERYETIGIEKMLTSNIAKTVVNHRSKHSQIIISLQDTRTADELSVISQASSRSARNFGRKLAPAEGVTQDILLEIMELTIECRKSKLPSASLRYTPSSGKNKEAENTISYLPRQKQERRSSYEERRDRRRSEITHRSTGKSGRY